MNLADFRTMVLGLPGVSALVDTRMFPLVIPQEVYDGGTEKPCIVYTTTARNSRPTFCGPDDLVRSSIELDVYGRTFDVCQQLADAVRLGIDGYRGTVGTTLFSPVFVDTESDEYFAEPGLYRRTFSLTVWSI